MITFSFSFTSFYTYPTFVPFPSSALVLSHALFFFILRPSSLPSALGISIYNIFIMYYIYILSVISGVGLPSPLFFHSYLCHIPITSLPFHIRCKLSLVCITSIPLLYPLYPQSSYFSEGGSLYSICMLSSYYLYYFRLCSTFCLTPTPFLL